MAGTEMLITSPTGVVMMRSSNALLLPQLSEELRNFPDNETAQILTLGGKQWFWLRSKAHALDAELFMVAPAALLTQIQNIFWILITILLLLLLGLIYFRYARINALVVQPLENLSERFQRIAAGTLKEPTVHSAQPIQELHELSKKFDYMENQIALREAALLEERQKLLEAKQHAERLEKVKSEFLANVSHEMRTPLTIILGTNHLLAADATPEQLKKIDQIESSGQSLLVLINDILDLEKIEAGKLEMRQQPFFLTDLVRGAVEKHRPLLKETIELSLDLQNAPSKELAGDTVRIQQVLHNLLGNAIKFTAQGKIAVQVATLERTPDAVRVRFSVSDTGLGVPAEQINEIFEQFTQADNSLARNFPGTGLGLAISKNLVELMGGTIGAQSVLGKGSTFWFELPLPIASEALKREATNSAVGERAPITTFNLTGLHVLVVDDSATIRHMVEMMLEPEGMRVSLASDGAEALRFLAQNPVDLVLMDVQMPTMDGLSCARQIRKQRRFDQLPIIALTAGVLGYQQDKVFQAGMNDALSKPIVVNQMIRMIAYWCNRSESQPKHPSTAHPASKFPELPGIDRARAEATTEGDLALFLDLLHLFKTEYGNAADEIERALARGDREEASRRLHKIRGSASQLSALALAATAAELEHQLEQLQDERLEPLLARFRAQLEELMAEREGFEPSMGF